MPAAPSLVKTPGRPAAEQASFHRRSFPLAAKAALVLTAAGLLVLVVLVPQAQTPSELRGERVWEEGSYEWVRDLDPRFEVGLVMGIIAGYLLLASILLGHPRLSSRVLPGRWRVRAHVTVGFLLLTLAVLHALVFAWLGAFETWPSGLASVMVLGYHGLSGVGKARLVTRWGARRWRFQHLLTAYTGLALGLVHSLLL